ncbi:hypothetical protein Tco_1080121 [Tanacetum coccineum]|uniref:Uncharacterized protein n=1 Tax=Tanacetum coccineum TaxID=301880 RepID=A0ABQ5HTU4_9ASTR
MIIATDVGLAIPTKRRVVLKEISNNHFNGSSIKVFAGITPQVDLTGQVLRGKSTRNVLVREAKFYCATVVIVGVSKIKDYGCKQRRVAINGEVKYTTEAVGAEVGGSFQGFMKKRCKDQV